MASPLIPKKITEKFFFTTPTHDANLNIEVQTLHEILIRNLVTDGTPFDLLT